MHKIQTCISLEMRPFITGCIPDGMPVSCVHTFSTERECLTAFKYINTNKLQLTRQLKLTAK
jgi:hypothetical protein